MKLDSTELNLIYASLGTYDDLILDEVKHETGVNLETWEKFSRLNRALRKKIYYHLIKEKAFHQDIVGLYQDMIEERNQDD
tara:strand:- start:38 stop:280 length:243 start_codon:yes stop_codon:yes gene_type:complete